MAINEFQHVRSGEPIIIPAATYNAMLDAAQAHRNRKINLTPHGAGFDSLYVYVENTTGKFLERFDVVGLDGPSETQNLDAFCNKIAFKGVVPEKKHKERFAVLQQDAAPNMLVRACVSGATIGKINVQKEPKDLVGLSCSAVDGETTALELGGGGAAVLWLDKGTGGKWAIIQLGANTLTAHVGKVSKEIKAGIDTTNDAHGGEVDEDDGEPAQRALAKCAFMRDTGISAGGGCGCTLVECDNPESPVFSGLDPEKPFRWKSRSCHPETCRFFTRKNQNAR